ncbi:MAG: glycosyltransferase family 4 protein [Planctomycetota bacterium]
MKLACVLGAFPNPSETFIAREIAALEARGAEVHVFPLWRDPAAPPDEQVDTPVERCGWLCAQAQLRSVGANARWQLYFLGKVVSEPVAALRGLWHLGTALEMARRMRALGVERVVGHFANAPSTAAWVAAQVAGLPLTLAVHARDVFVEPHLLAAKARDAEAVLACNSAVAERTRQLIAPADRAKVALIHHGIPLDEFPLRDEPPPAGDGPPLILGVGRLVEKKGFVHLVRAVARLRDRDVVVACWLIGEGPERQTLEREIAVLGLDDAVKLMGWMTPAELKMTAYEQASLLAMPSVVARDGDRDGLPNVLLEAAAIGVPLVATDVGALGDLVRDGETGLIARPADPADLARAIQTVLDDPEAAAARALQARAEVEARFDAARQIDQLAAALGLP